VKINFDGIQAFVVTAELGNFSKAADQLHITQTALSRRVQALEAQLDLKLLYRTTRLVELTPVGKEFLPQARAMVSEMRNTIARLKESTAQNKGSFTLACLPSMASYLLPQLIQRYAKHYPHNRIRMIDASSFEVREAVLKNHAEFGVAIQNEAHPDLVESHLLDDALVFICPKKHVLSHQASVSWAEMKGIDLISVSGLMATRISMDYQLSKRGITLKSAYEVQHHATAVSLVSAGLGCAILPSSTLPDGERPGLVKVPLVRPTVKRKVALIRRKNVQLSPAAQIFHDLMLEDVQDVLAH